MNTWSISKKANEDISSLNRAMWETSVLPRTRQKTSIIRRLVARNEIGTIPALIPCLFGSNKRVHQAAADGIGILLDLVPSFALVKLRERCQPRYWHGYGSSDNWAQLNLKSSKAYLDRTNDFALGCLMTFHGNGHVRETAVKFLEKFDTGAELRFLIIRQNDWVDKVANEATRIVSQRLDDQHADQFASEIELAIQLSRSKRRDHTKFVDAVFDLLLQEQHSETIRQLVLTSASGNDHRVHREIVSKLLSREGSHREFICQFTSESDQSSCRLLAVKTALKCMPNTKCKALANRLTQDHHAIVREAAYELQAALNPQESQSIWKHCLLDKNSRVRRTAQFHCRKAGLQPEIIYRASLVQSPNSLPALAGLAECGSDEDLPIFQSFLDSSMPSRRCEAIRGIANHGSSLETPRLLPLLLDTSSRVLNAASNAILNAENQPKATELRGLLSETTSIKNQTAIIDLMSTLDRWKALGPMIELATRNDESLRTLVEKRVTFMFSSGSFLKPSKKEKESIEITIQQAINDLSADFLRSLQIFLSPYEFEF